MLNLTLHVICRGATVAFLLNNVQLHIETGRYKNPPTALADRLCCFCDDNVLENELHFLCD